MAHVAFGMQVTFDRWHVVDTAVVAVDPRHRRNVCVIDYERQRKAESIVA